jgi:uncharacterized membrane protein YtjA (UPF0391 family)
MFKWTATFFVISVVAAVIGFTTDIDLGTASIARYVFFVAIGLTFVSAIIGAMMKHHRTD